MLLTSTEWDEVLHRTAFYAENHAIKGALVLEALSADEAFADMSWRGWLSCWQLLDSPRAVAMLSTDMQFDVSGFATPRLQSIVRAGVFPLAYSAAVVWESRVGLRAMVQSARSHVLEHVDELGHSFTIWKSFADVAQRELTPEQRALAAERFAEFLGAPSLRSEYQAPSAAEPLAPDAELASLVPRAARCMGFMGHTVITLSAGLSAPLALDEKRMLRDALHNVLTRDEAVAARPEPSTGALQDAMRVLLTEGPRDVHTLTFAHAAWSLRPWLTSDDEDALSAALLVEAKRILRRG